jgi:thiol-disulfide isomerase/thioredoxin
MHALLLALLLAGDLAEVRTAGDVLHSFRKESRVRVVSVWATWCAPCVAEIGDVQAIADQFHGKRVEVIGVSLDDMIPGERAATKTRVAQFLEQRHVRFRNVYYTGAANELADDFRFDGSIPITLVFDENGHELLRNEGVLDKKWLAAQLETLIAKRRTTK